MLGVSIRLLTMLVKTMSRNRVPNELPTRINPESWWAGGCDVAMLAPPARAPSTFSRASSCGPQGGLPKLLAHSLTRTCAVFVAAS
jgi:hypothetical protein